MLSDFCIKRQNKIGKIFKKSKFYFFQIEPKIGKNNLSKDLKNLRNTIFSDLYAILEQNRISCKVCNLASWSPILPDQLARLQTLHVLTLKRVKSVIWLVGLAK